MSSVLPAPDGSAYAMSPHVQVEGRVLAEEQGVVGEAVVADTLVAEGREGERLGAVGRGGEGAEGAQQVGRRRVEARVADSVVVRLAGAQVGELGVQVVLGVVAAHADAAWGVERAHLGLDLAGEVPGVGADTDVRLLHRGRDLPGDRDLRARVVAEGEVAAEGGDESAVDLLGLGRGGPGRDRGLRDGARYEGTARDGAEGHGTASDHVAPRELGAEILVLLGHAHVLGELLRYAHAWSVHGLRSCSRQSTRRKTEYGQIANSGP